MMKLHILILKTPENIVQKLVKKIKVQ